MTRPAASLACRAVPPLRQFAVLFLCALWLPATTHCDFEAAGLTAWFHCDSDHHSAGSKDSAGDNCDTLENGQIRRASADLAVAAPALHLLFLSCAFSPADLVSPPPPCGLTGAITPPPELGRTWQFTARAAPPSRAPSLAS